MDIADRRNYAWDPDELECVKRAGIPGRLNPVSRCLVEVFDGDGEMFGVVRWDRVEELCRILNTFTPNAELSGGEAVRSDDLLVCPFCGQHPQYPFKYGGLDLVICNNAKCVLSSGGMTVEQWQTRYTNYQAQLRGEAE